MIQPKPICWFCIALSGLIGPGALKAQTPVRTPLEFPAASPACTIKQRVGLTDIEVIYSRPSLKGRAAFGALVPYGEVWRTGANAATRLTFSTPVRLQGVEVPAGTYALCTIPGRREWTVILSRNTALWGAFNYDSRDDVARVKAVAEVMPAPVETLTIEFDALRDESAMLYLAWERTRIPLEIEVDLSELPTRIEATMAEPEGRKPYFQAANYYYNHGLDLDQALAWVEASIAQREFYFNLHLKAQILARRCDRAGAIAAAERSMELALAANDQSYVRLNQALITSLPDDSR